ncbi:MAG: hypothetical protein JOY62_18400 [Acidobacteriaceae bacterium]|nr:hypothetical protein [Acidobacteriaceae bacterium]MBV9781938.1 hypothetical protein [Acidobacteriaceae bacterium]
MSRKWSRGFLLAGCLPIFSSIVFAQQPPSTPQSVHLQVEAGTPLRLYITHRVWFRKNETVQAKFADPVWAFDRVVIPAGTVIQGQVTNLISVPGTERARAIVGGDFTPLKRAEVSFSTATLPDGRTLQLQTQESLGLSTIYVPGRAKKRSKQRSSPKIPSRASQFIRSQAQAQLNARSRGLFDFIRGPNKREWLENFLMTKLPYHPEWYRSGTRFDAVLAQPVDFGNVSVAPEELEAIGSYPGRDVIAQMRILSDISSADAHVGDSMEGELSQPLFSSDHQLVLPEGTRVHGKITLARPARFLRRGGQLRFAIQDIELPTVVANIEPRAPASVNRSQPAQAQLVEAEADPGAVKVDPEGTAKATELKTRFLRPAIAGLIAVKSMDNDTGKQTASGTGSPNTAGRGLGGFSGFGLLGIAASKGPPQVAAGLGFYGLAWSVYSTIISRGGEVRFQKNTAMAIRFGSPPRTR